MAAARALLHRYLDEQFFVISDAVEHGRTRALLPKLVRNGAKGGSFVAQFLQYVTAAWTMHNLCEHGDLNALGDWAGWALASEIQEEHEQAVHPDRLKQFFANDDFVSWGKFLPTAAVFLGAFYYYARRRAAMKDLAISFWPEARWTLQRLLGRDKADVQVPEGYLGVSMLAWAAIDAEELARELTPVIEQSIDQEFPDDVRAMFCLALATHGGKFSTNPAVEWARRALAEFSGSLVNEQRTQMLVTVSDPTDRDQAADVVAEMRGCQEAARRTLEPIEFLRHAARRSDVIRPFFLRAARGCACPALVSGLRAWHLLDNTDPIDPATLLVTIPFGEDGFLCLSNSQKLEILRDSQAVLEQLSREINAFLGTAKTVTGADNSGIRIPERPGVPRIDESIGLHDAMRIAYCPTPLPQQWTPDNQLILPPEGHPVQAVQLAVWGRTWPLCASLKRRRPDRRIRRVFLWSGGGTLAEEMELEFVRECFEAVHVTVDTHIAVDSTAAEFAAVYSDPTVDVLWVMSHGEFDHWAPHEATLQVSRKGDRVSLADLWRHSPETEDRRLLFLNACDAGRFEEGGLLPHIGLAPGVAGPAQAVISHLWPVTHFPSATFGAFLATCLSQGQSFFDSFQSALGALHNDAPASGTALERLCGFSTPLTQRLRQRDEDFTPLEISGSPVFYE